MKKLGRCNNCSYFRKKDWSFIPFKIFGLFGLTHRIKRVAGHCHDDQNANFNWFALENGRGIKKTDVFFAPKWCRLREEK